MSDRDKKVLVGLVGYPGSGKDALTEELCRWGGYSPGGGEGFSP